MRPLKTKVSITLDENVIDTIRRMAEEDDRNFSQYINLILKEWIMTHGNINMKLEIFKKVYKNTNFILNHISI